MKIDSQMQVGKQAKRNPLNRISNSKNKIKLWVVAILFCPFSLANQSDTFNQAQALLQQSNLSEEQAKQSLLQANITRQLISRIRVEARREKDPAQQQTLQQRAAKQAEALQRLQKAGAEQRADAIQKKKAAMDLFSQGLANRWQSWINNTQPLTMDKETLDYISHNAVVRSVHPTMLNKMGLNETKNQRLKQQATSEADNGSAKMSLKIASLVGQSAPADLDISAFQLSNDQNYLAHIEVHQANDASHTNVSQVPLNQMHQWRLLLTDLNGEPVAGKNIHVLGHMPGHVHGLPTQPAVTKELDKGVYLVEGVKFQMQGWWVMQFEFASSDTSQSTSQEDALEQKNALDQEKSLGEKNSLSPSELTDSKPSQNSRQSVANTRFTFNLIL